MRSICVLFMLYFILLKRYQTYTYMRTYVYKHNINTCTYHNSGNAHHTVSKMQVSLKFLCFFSVYFFIENVYRYAHEIVVFVVALLSFICLFGNIVVLLLLLLLLIEIMSIAFKQEIHFNLFGLFNLKGDNFLLYVP